jgi:hypothetical protein
MMAVLEKPLYENDTVDLRSLATFLYMITRLMPSMYLQPFEDPLFLRLVPFSSVTLLVSMARPAI